MPDNKEEFDFNNADNDEIIDRFHEDPKGFVTMVASQVRGNLEAENAERQQESEVIKTYQDFRDQYPDFEDRWESGEIKQFMDAHPGHNALSAYLNISQQTQIKQAVAQKLAEKGLSDDPALSDTKKHGGQNTVMADRLRAMRTTGGHKGQPSEPSETGELISTI